ncbi:hypothetical protein RND81_06G124500 [Saponaria officinalis]|uniref:Uncharacterized protein n=1 Tax=Saponaria officinalis TaxID=3572 RepID=A0AAW1K954_SAPOF
MNGGSSKYTWSNGQTWSKCGQNLVLWPKTRATVMGNPNKCYHLIPYDFTSPTSIHMPYYASVRSIFLKILRNSQQRIFPKTVQNFLKNPINPNNKNGKVVSPKYGVLQSSPLKRISSRNSENSNVNTLLNH